MEVSVNLGELPSAHPHLLWRDIRLAAVVALAQYGRKSPFPFELTVREVPGFDDDVLQMTIDSGRIRNSDLTRVRQTYEPWRLIEFAAVAITGLGLYYAGEHQIHGVAWRGSGADYLVGEERYRSKLRADHGAMIWNPPGKRNGEGYPRASATISSSAWRNLKVPPAVWRSNIDRGG